MDLRQTAYPDKYSQYHMAVSLFSRHGHVYLSRSGKMMYLSLCRVMEDVKWEEQQEDMNGSI
jgi:hypothetical protein